MFKLAQLGVQYEKQLQDEVVRLCLSLELGASEPVLRAVAEKASAEDLMELKQALQQKMAQLLPAQTQLPGAGRVQETVESGFLI